MGRDGGRDVVRRDGLHRIAWDKLKGLRWDGMRNGMGWREG